MKERGVSARAANQNILRGAEGPRGRAKTVKTLVEGFELFITDEMMQTLSATPIRTSGTL